MPIARAQSFAPREDGLDRPPRGEAAREEHDEIVRLELLGHRHGRRIVAHGLPAWIAASAAATASPG